MFSRENVLTNPMPTFAGDYLSQKFNMAPENWK